MKPIDSRNLTWEGLQGQLTEKLVLVYRALQTHGPATVRELAERAEIDILTIAPRMFDLRELGLCEKVEDVRVGRVHCGRYRAVLMDEWRANAERITRNAEQMALL